MSSSERYEYDKMRMERDLQKDTWDWVVWRLWIGAALIVLIGLFGVRAFVREMVASELKDAARAAAQAEAAAKATSDVTAEVRVEAARYKALVADLSDAAMKLDERFKELDARITAEGAHAVASSEVQLSRLSGHVQELSEVVKRLISESRESQGALEKYQARIQQVDAAAANESARFLENSKYLIRVTAHPKNLESTELQSQLIKELTSQGYRAVAGQWADAVKIDPKKIKITHRNAENTAQKIRRIVARTAKRNNLDIAITVSDKLHASYKEEDVVIFLGVS